MKTLEEPTGRESDHLLNKYDASVDENLIKQMVIFHDEGKSNQMIKDEMNLSISRQHIGRIIKTYKDKRIQNATDFEVALTTGDERGDENAPF